MSDEALTTSEVVLKRIIDADGRMHVSVKLPENYNAVEVLGLIEMSKLYVYNKLLTNFPKSE